MQDLLKVGKIVNTHGVRGEVRVISTTDFPEKRYQPGKELFLEHPNLNNRIKLKINSHRLHKQFNLLTFEGYNNINDVEKFKNGILKVSKDELDELEENEFYYHEIIGCEVYSEVGEHLGVIKEILSPGANDVWVIKRTAGKDVLIPYIEEVVKRVDVANQKVIIHIMEGLLE